MDLVLVVDDDADIRESLGMVLEDAGCAVVCAANGHDALQVLRRLDSLPTLIFLDLAMPVMTGWELLEELQRDPVLRAIPAVVVSAMADERPPGAIGYLAKPPRVDDILQILAARCDLGSRRLRMSGRAG